MSVYDPIDLEALLAPLADGEQGAGQDLRLDYSPTSYYQRLRDSRAAARAEERSRDASGEEDGAEARGWYDVLAVGQEAIALHSKDIEVAAWLTEALVRLQGLKGLTDGARLIAGLCERYWDAAFPRPDEDGMEARSRPIGGLAGTKPDGTVMQPLRRIPLFQRADGSPVSLYQWEQSEQAVTLDETRQAARYNAGVPRLSDLEAEARLDRERMRGTAILLLGASEAWKALELVLDAKLGSDSPSIRSVQQVLDRSLEVLKRLGGVPEAEEATPAEDATAPAAPSGTNGQAGAARPAGVMTRESALQDLDRIADYFRKTEPHSPLAYTLEEAVRRGRMTLAELLAEVLPDTSARRDMLQRLGIRPAD